MGHARCGEMKMQEQQGNLFILFSILGFYE